MTRPETLDDLVKGVDTVFHIAAVFNYSAPWEVLEKVTVLGTKALCDRLLAEKNLKRLVLWGSGGVYPTPGPGDLPLRESMAYPDPPMNNYFRSKIEQEKLVRDLGASQGLPFTIVRPTTIYGPRAVYGGGQLVLSMVNVNPVTLPANFTFRMPFSHVHDVCAAALYLARLPQAKGEVYNITDDSSMSMLEYGRFMASLMGHVFVKLPPVPIVPTRALLVGLGTALGIVAKRTGKPPPLEADPARLFGRDYAFSNEKLKNTGYQLLYPDPRHGLRDTVKWYREQGWC
jgi:nucleoside-diphosphate-sugar epimerase